MGLNQNIVKLLKEKNITKAQLAKGIGIPYTTLDSMLKRDSDASKIETIYKISEYLEVSLDELVFEDGERNTAILQNITEKEIELLRMYRKMDSRGKGAVDAVMSYELEAKDTAKIDKTQIYKKTLPKKEREIQIFNSPAAAGEPLPVLSEDFSVVKTRSAPSSASFGIKIVGDSMEPLIENASVVWVKKQPVIDDREIGIFILNGESLCKRLEYHDGKCYLISLNKKYSPIKILESDDLRVVGKVLL